MLDALDVFDDPEPQNAAFNMALDEALFETAAVPALRFYRWRRPSISFGYFGQFADVAEYQPHRDIVRRWTGGGVVPHGEDITYSLVIPAADPLFQRSSPAIYADLHEAVRRALQHHGIAAELTDIGAPKISEECFANPVRADVIVAGRKIAGAAHRRSRRGLLHQGSIQLSNLSGNFRSQFAQMLSTNLTERLFLPAVIERASELAEEKYGTAAWLKRR